MRTARFSRVLFSIVALVLVLVVAMADSLATRPTRSSPGNPPAGQWAPSFGGPWAPAPAGIGDPGKPGGPAQPGTSKGTGPGQVTPRLGVSVKNDVSPPLASIPPVISKPATRPPEQEWHEGGQLRPREIDPVVQRGYGLDPFSLLNPLAMPEPLVNVEGIGFIDSAPRTPTATWGTTTMCNGSTCH